jgi:hypothetical protein
MTFDQMLKELPTLTPDQRRELAHRALEMDDGEGFTPQEEQMFDQRIKAFEAAPDTGMTWEQVKASVLADLQK